MRREAIDTTDTREYVAEIDTSALDRVKKQSSAPLARDRLGRDKEQL